MSELLKKYTRYNDCMRAKGIKLVEFECPACGHCIETRPAPLNEVWDTFSTCPHCEQLFFKVTKGADARGYVS